MQRFICLLAVIVFAFIAGCASDRDMKPMTQDQISHARAVDEYTPPSIKPPLPGNLKITLNASVSKVCKAIEAYAQSQAAAPFVLTHNIYQSGNRNKASATIMLNVAEPQSCLDCGVNYFAYYDGDRLVKDWKYDVAIKEIVLAFGEKDTLSRFLSLVGQANIVVTPLAGNKSQVSIDIDYLLERKVTAYTTRQLGQEKVLLPVTGISVGKFNSTQVGELEDEVICVSRGALENRILDGIRSNLK